MMGGRTSEEWIAQYATSHQHPVNRTCHTFGIPMIAVSIPILLLGVLLCFWKDITEHLQQDVWWMRGLAFAWMKRG